MEMPRSQRLYVIVDSAGEPVVWGEGEEYNVSVYASRDMAESHAEAGKGSVLTLTLEVLKAALDGPWAERVTHVAYHPASNVGVQLSAERFAEVY
jgi:hypothetical protein